MSHLWYITLENAIFIIYYYICETLTKNVSEYYNYEKRKKPNKAMHYFGRSICTQIFSIYIFLKLTGKNVSKWIIDKEEHSNG